MAGRETQVWEGRCGQGEVRAQVLPLARLSQTAGPERSGLSHAISDYQDDYSTRLGAESPVDPCPGAGCPRRGRREGTSPISHLASGSGPPSRQRATHIAAAMLSTSAAGRKHSPFLGGAQPW